MEIPNSESEVEDAVTEVPIKAIAKAPCSPVKWSDNPSKKPKPVLKVGGCKVKQEPQVIKQTVVTRAVIGSVAISRSRVLDVPGFMDAAWANTFLPMLYDIFGCSQYPFSHFLKSGKVVKNIQDVINLVWPGTNYDIQWSDAVCSKVRGVPPWFCMTH